MSGLSDETLLLRLLDSLHAFRASSTCSPLEKFVVSFLKIVGFWLVLLVLLGGIFVWISSKYENPRELLPEDMFS